MVLWLHFPDLTTLRAGKSQTILPHPLNPLLFYMCNLPDSGRHVTRPNQGLSTDTRDNLGTG